MAIKIPQNNKWRQTNLSDILGSLWSSWNLDLTDNLGVTKVSPRTLLINDDTTNMGVPVAFKFFDTKWWAICGTLVFNNSGDTDDAFSEDATTGFQSDYDSDESDFELFNGFLYSTTTDGVFKRTSGGNWSASLATLDTGTAHFLVEFAARLYVTTNSTEVHSLTTADAVTAANGPPNTNYNALDLSVYGGALKNTITCMKATTQYIWIGVLNRTRGIGRVYYWDGAQSTPNGYYELDSVGAVAMVIKDDVPWIVDANGALLAFNGGTFVEVARLPYDKRKFLGLPYDVDNTDRFIHPNGIAVVDDKINILVRNEYLDSSTSVGENFPSGVWEYDEDIGLYHKMSLSQHTNGGSVTDYGQNILSKVGAVVKAKDDNNAAGADGSMLIGAQYLSSATATKEGIWIDNAIDTIQKFGYLVTTKIFSQNVDDIWQKLFVRLKKLLASTD